jgi:hypothetical protein
MRESGKRFAPHHDMTEALHQIATRWPPTRILDFTLALAFFSWTM